MRINVRHAAAAAAAAAITFAGCGDDGGLEAVYQPPVTFQGYVNGIWYELPGYRSYPNRCSVERDTLKMRFYSEDYNPDPVPAGMYMSIDVFPFHPETLYTTFDTIIVPHPNTVALGEVRFHFVTHTGSTCSYDIVPADTLKGDIGFSMWFESLRRTRGSSAEFYEMTVAAPALGFYCGWELLITEGEISGRIE